MSANSYIITTEKQLCKAYIDNIELLPDKNYFLSETGREFYEILSLLKDQGFKTSKEHILKYAKEHVTSEVYEQINTTSYQETKISSYFMDLKKESILDTIDDIVLNDLMPELSKKGEKDFSVVKKIINNITVEVDKYDLDDTTLKTFYEFMASHKEVLEERLKGSQRQSSGCPSFDSLLPAQSLISGFALIFARSGSGKTTFLDYLLLQRNIKRLPTLAINTELAQIIKKDNFICSLCRLDYDEVMGANNEDYVMDQYVIDKYDEMLERFEKNKNFLLEERQALSIYDLPEIIKSARKRMKLKDNQILFFGIDLLTQLKEFGQSKSGLNKADVIENAVNYLNELALATNTLIVGLVQPKRVDSKVSIKTLDDLEKLRPSLEEIKSSGAFEERARLVFSLHNPFHQAKKHLDDEIALLTVSPVIECQLLKSNIGGKVGKIVKYFHYGSMKKLKIYKEEYEDKELSA